MIETHQPDPAAPRCARRRVALALLATCISACAPSGPAVGGVLHVHAASSLAEAFQELERAFERRHPFDVRLTLAGSQILRLQIEQGAGADVFASADPGHMATLAALGAVRGATTFARNALVVVVPRDNPAGIDEFDQLPRARRIVIGSESVPVGRYARQLLRNASRRLGAAFEQDVLGRVVSLETNARLVRARVELGEADAAIVYATDARGSDALTVIPIPEADRVAASYEIAATTGAVEPEAAELWIELVLSGDGQEILARNGFERVR